MAQYIKREDAIDICTKCVDFQDSIENINASAEAMRIRRLIKEMPSADVVPRKDYESMERTVDKLNKSLFFLSTIKRNRAKWIYNDMSRRICSNCGNPVVLLIDGNWYEGDFCPNCGADMRGEKMITLCNSCEQQESCKIFEIMGDSMPITHCKNYIQTRRETVRVKQTNADRIRSMSDEELAEKLTWIVPYCGDCPARIGNGEECAKDCKKAWLAWLRKEADEKEM